MRKGRDGGKEKTDENSGHYIIASSRPPKRWPLERRMLVPKNGENKKRLMKIVATTSLPAVDRTNDTARTTPPERRPLERRRLVPKISGHKNLCAKNVWSKSTVYMKKYFVQKFQP